MAYKAYRCKDCGKTIHFFEEEVDLVSINWGTDHEYEKLPPSPVVIHATDCFMAEPILDSMDTGHELDRILTMEARIAREEKMLDQIRKNM